MTPKGNQYAIAALKDRRATIAGELVQFKEAIRYREELLAHLDASLRLFDPDYKADTIPPKRLRRLKLFAAGELNRTILDVLRRANGKPLRPVDIARTMAADKGYQPDTVHALAHRVRANLNYLLRRKELVVKTGERLSARWTLR